MAITIAWGTKIISVPKADMTLVQSTPFEIRELNLDTFRLTLKGLEDDEDGMPFLRTHNHNTEVTVGGVTLARVIELINGYTVTFEDAQYAVNLAGANSNVSDKVNLNQVSVRAANSAGLTKAVPKEEIADEILARKDEIADEILARPEMINIDGAATLLKSGKAKTIAL